MTNAANILTPTHSPNDGKTTFLSVIVYRTLRNLSLLSETLLVLFGQTCPDFEVVVTGKASATPDDGEAQALIDGFPSSLRKRTHLVASSGNTRAEALNNALDHTHGRYVSFIDEGDLPFDNWVASLKEAAAREDGSILFSYSIEQVWELISKKGSDDILRSVGKLDPSSCHPFDASAYLAVPEYRGPSFAYPVNAAQEGANRFDEAFCALESWEYLMRALGAHPLVTIDQPLSLTRVWRRPAQAGMRPSIWDETFPFPDEAERTEELYRKEYDRVAGHLSVAGIRTSLRLYPRTTPQEATTLISRQTFSQTCRMSCIPNDSRDPFTVHADIGRRASWTLRYTPEAPCPPLDQIDFVIDKAPGCMTLSGFMGVVEDVCGEEQRFDMASCEHNGLQIDCSHVVFLSEAPVLSLRFATPIAPARVHVKLEGRSGISKEHIGQFTKGRAALWTGRVKRWALRRVNRL